MDDDAAIKIERKIVERIARAIEHSGKSVPEIAECAQINKATLFRILKHERRPKVATLIKLSEVLDQPIVIDPNAGN